MIKIDPTVKKETLKIAIGALICGVILNVGYFALSRIFPSAFYYRYTALTATALGIFASVLNFFLMGLAVQRTVALENSDEAKKKFQFSYMRRTFLLLLIVGVGLYFRDYFQWFCLVASVFFPRVVILFRTAYMNVKKQNEATQGDTKEGDS